MAASILFSSPNSKRLNKMTDTQNTSPIYILGNTPLSYYLATKFQSVGENVELILKSKEYGSVENTTFTIKEDAKLPKSHTQIKSSFWTRSPAKMLIICSFAEELNSDIISISKEKIKNCPVLLFSLTEETKYLEEILDSHITQCWLDGWIIKKNNHIGILGETPTINIYTPCDKALKKQLEHLFTPTEIKLNFAQHREDSFWHFFTIYASCSLISASCNKSILQILKNKPLYTLLEKVVEECMSLHKFSQSKLDSAKIMEEIKNIPTGYIFPLQENINLSRSGDFNIISNILLNQARKKSQPIPVLSDTIKQIYNIYLSIN